MADAAIKKKLGGGDIIYMLVVMLAYWTGNIHTPSAVSPFHV